MLADHFNRQRISTIIVDTLPFSAMYHKKFNALTWTQDVDYKLLEGRRPWRCASAGILSGRGCWSGTRRTAIWPAMASRLGRWNSYWVHRSRTASPSGRNRVARCSRCRRATSRSMTGSGESIDSLSVQRIWGHSAYSAYGVRPVFMY
jgi:hypothetical protein